MKSLAWRISPGRKLKSEHYTLLWERWDYGVKPAVARFNPVILNDKWLPGRMLWRLTHNKTFSLRVKQASNLPGGTKTHHLLMIPQHYILFFNFYLPYIVPFTISLPVADETRACLVQKLIAVGAFETWGVPLQIRGYSQYILVQDLPSTANTRRWAPLLCKTQLNIWFNKQQL